MVVGPRVVGAGECGPCHQVQSVLKVGGGPVVAMLHRVVHGYCLLEGQPEGGPPCGPMDFGIGFPSNQLVWIVGVHGWTWGPKMDAILGSFSIP